MSKPKLPPPRKIVANNIIDIKKIVEAFETQGEKNLLGKCLLEGFEMIKRHQELDADAILLDADPDMYGGFKPAAVPKNADRSNWLDNMIRTQMGGRREGLRVVWDTIEGKYSFDPWTAKLEKVI
jgi:hypothetical protein